MTQKERRPVPKPRPGAFTSQGTRGPGDASFRAAGTGLREANESPAKSTEERLSPAGAAH